MTNKQTGTSGLVERLEATIHQINGHWWNRRKRPEAPDIREAIDRLASLSPVPVDEVERDIRIAIWNAGMNGGMGQDLTQAFIGRAMDEAPMKRALAALTASRPSDDGWMPIDTAPKELKRCLLFCPEKVSLPREDDGIVMGRFAHGEPYGNGMSGDWVFTHWRPLPDAPAALSSLVGEK